MRFRNINIADYQAGSIVNSASFQGLASSIQTSNAERSTMGEALNAASSREEERFEAFLADQRVDRGWLQVVTGGLVVVGGVAAIVVTAGAATPFVVWGGAIAGVGASAYGLSNAIEGGHNIALGRSGDATTDALNPARDIIFNGNQEVYDTVGAVFIASSAIFSIGAGGLNAYANAGTRGLSIYGGRVFITSGASIGGNLGGIWVGENVFELNSYQARILGVGTGALSSIVTGTSLNSLDRRFNLSGHSKPHWSQSELDMEARHPNHNSQRTFLNGEEMPYGTKPKGSSIPDLTREGSVFRRGSLIEVKNYDLSRQGGINSLIRNSVRQLNNGVNNIPDVGRTLAVDIRGQSVSASTLKYIRASIIAQANDVVRVQFIRLPILSGVDIANITSVTNVTNLFNERNSRIEE